MIKHNTYMKTKCLVSNYNRICSNWCFLPVDIVSKISIIIAKLFSNV